MFYEIWENIKNTFAYIWNNFISKLIKPMYFTFGVFGLYCFINYLIYYKVLLAFGSLFVALVCFKMFEEE